MASKDGGPRKTWTEMVDRLSSLPDELLSHILSLLPTKFAVGTSILSNRWKYLWTSLTSFHFNGKIDRHSTNIFDHVFRSCSSSHIHKFSLHITYIYHDSNVDVTAWIEEATKRNVSELDIQVYGVKLPLSVFSCRTLKILTLAYYHKLDGNPVSFNLPCLKVLHITIDSYLSGFIETLISSCPVLEDLTLGGYLDNEEEHFMVSAPMLKTLQLHLSRNYCIPAANKISVIAPNLQYFHLDGYFVRFKIKGDFSSVVKACVNIRDISLGGSYRPFQRYHQLDGNPVSFNLPCLKVLHIMKDSYLYGFIETLISSCPVLEDLTLGGYLDNEEEHFMVSAPMLKTLQLHLSPNNRIPAANKISVIAPNLLYFHLGGYFIRYKIKGDFSSVVKACVNISDISLGGWYRYRPFQRDLPHRFTFPKFHNLKYLEVISRHYLFWTTLPKLIRNSPSLEVLSIEQHGHDMRADLYTWEGPTSVHKCLRVHLAEIKIKGFTGRKHELQLLKYFLGNAKVLQRLTITCPAELKQAQKTMFCEKLLKFPKASRKCQIEYQGELISN